MEIDFPSSSAAASPEDLSKEELFRFIASSTNDNNLDDDVEESILSGVTSTSSVYQGGGSLLWPSSDDEGNKKKRHRSSKKKSGRHHCRQRIKNDRTTNSTANAESQKQQRPRRRLTESSYTSSNYEVGAGEIAVDFPTDRTPFLRRYSSDEYSGSGGEKNKNDARMLNESLTLVVTEGMKEDEHHQHHHHPYSSGSSHEGGGGGSKNNNSKRRGSGGGGPIRRRSSLGSRGSLGSKSGRSSVTSTRSRSSDSLTNSRHQQQRRGRPIRRRSSLGSRDSLGYGSNDSSALALNAFLHHQQQQSSRPDNFTKSLATIHSQQEVEVTQSLRELELKRSLRASLMKRNKSTGHLQRRPSAGSTERSIGSLERRPRSIGDLLEAEAEQSKSLVAAHNATVQALPIVGWDVENQSDTSSLLLDDQQSRGNNSVGLQRSFRRASTGTFEHDGSITAGGGGPEHHDSIPTPLVSSLNNNNADNPNPDGQFLCEEFVSRSSFQKMKSNPNNMMFAEDNKSGSNGKGSPMEQQFIMEEEYDPRKPWRKAPAVAVNCRDNNRRATNATFRSSMASSMNFEEFLMSMGSQQPQKEVKGSDENQKDQQQQQVDDYTDQDKSIRSSRSLRSIESTPDNTPTAPTGAAAPVVNEVPSHSPMEDASLSTALRASKTEDSTALSSLAVDNDDDSELTDLRLAQEALFPIQEGGFKKKLSEEYSDASELRYSGQSDAVSGVSFGVDALENSEQILFDDGERKVAHRNDFSLDIVQEEDERMNNERIQQKKEQQKQQLIEEIILEQEQLQKQREEKEALEHEREEELSKRRNTLSSDDFGANQIREDLQLDDLPSSVGDVFSRRKISQDGNDAFDFSEVDVTSPRPKTRVFINHTDESIENEFATTKLEDIEFGHQKSKLYQDEEDNMDRSELGLLFEASRNEDILKDDSIRSSRHSGFASSKTGSKSGSRKTSSTLESAMKPIKFAMMKGASTLDKKATSNIRRRNKRLWKFCVWNCRKITICVVLLIGILVTIGVLAWLGAVKNKQPQPQNPGDDGTVDKETVTKSPLATGSDFISQPLEIGSTQYPSLSPSQSSSQPSTFTIVQDGLGKLEPSPVNDSVSLADDSTAGNETDANTGVPSISPVTSTQFVNPTNPPISVNAPSIKTDIVGEMSFSQPVPQDSAAALIIFLDALKKSIRSAVSPSLNPGEELRYVDIISINGQVVDELILRLRRRFLGRWLQTDSVVFSVVILTECDVSLCSDLQESTDSLMNLYEVADGVSSRVQNEMTMSVTSGAFASLLEVAMASSSGGTLEYATAVELSDLKEPTVSVLSPNQANETSTTDTLTLDVANATVNEVYSSTLVGNETNSTDGTTPVDVDPKANETNLTLFVNETAAASANATTTITTSITHSLSEDGNQTFTTNANVTNSNVTSNSVVIADADESTTDGLEANETLPSFANSTVAETESRPEENVTAVSNGNSTADGLGANATLPSFANSTVAETESLPEESEEDTTVAFNVSALDALFFPNP